MNNFAPDGPPSPIMTVGVDVRRHFSVHTGAFLELPRPPSVLVLPE